MTTRLFTLLGFLFGGLTLNAASTNVLSEFFRSFPETALLPPENGSPVFAGATQRITERLESRLLRPMALDYFLDENGESLQDRSTKRGRALFADGFRYSLREWGLHTPAYQWLDERFGHVGDWFSSFWRDTLSPNVERYNAQSPKNFAFEEPHESFYGFKKGLRPFEQNPYAYVSYGLRDSAKELILESTLQIRMRDWQSPAFSFITEVPIGLWGLGVGIEGQTDVDKESIHTRQGQIFRETKRPLDLSLGLRGQLLGGFVRIGADIMSKRCLVEWDYDF